MTKVLFVETSPSGVVGGSFLSLFELIRALDKTRYQPLVLFRHNHYLVDDFCAAGAEVFIYQEDAPPSTNGKSRGAKLKPYVWRILEAIKQRRNVEIMLATRRDSGFIANALDIIQKHKVDLLHLNDGLTPSIPFIAVAPPAIPTVVHERKIRRYASRERRYLRRVNRIICISQAVAANLDAYFPNFSRTVILPNPLSTRFKEPLITKSSLLKQLGLPEDALLVIQVSNIINWKGQDILLEAMKTVSKNHAKSVLIFTGGTPLGEEAYEAKLRKMAKFNGLENRVRFCGFQEEVSSFYQAADVLVHVPSYPEPFGRTVLEAMQLGKPMITSNSGGTAELVQHGVTGLLVPPGDAKALASALLSLLSDESLRQKLGTKAAKVAQERYSPQKIARKIEAIYEELIDGLRT
ncbi:MAG: glycosyltransferase family 4 protein [Deltaproteobacteria bacterium]|nr:glycosyltransferase family 4 protein [Desulfitobacteriaceae bacterium]MDI6855024.1 glycosyltransferase family 4 protein [Deltaproteobacteria bacterium]